MNFITEFKKGQAGGNQGLPMGDGLANISNAINGVQRARIYGIAAAPKVGKSTFADYGFVIQPYLYVLSHPDIIVEWIYFSFELDRVSKEFDFATFFLFNDYGIEAIQLDEGVTKDGLSTIDLTPDYLRGRVQDDNGNIIKVKESVQNVLKEVYEHRIIPLFGEFSVEGTQIKKGYITFIEQKDNPTGMYKFLKHHAEKQGHFIKVKTPVGERIQGYIPNNPNKYTIIVTDHLRKLVIERGYLMKQNVDKYIEYSVELRNWCGFTFVHIIHLNRNLADQARMKNFGDMLYPTSDDIKDTGNLSEDADFVFTMFNPNDEKYNLKKHFGINLKDRKENNLYPNLRTLHLVESRHCEFPQHFRTDMYGKYKTFKQLIIK